MRLRRLSQPPVEARAAGDERPLSPYRARGATQRIVSPSREVRPVIEVALLVVKPT